MIAFMPTETPADKAPLLSAASTFTHGFSSTKKGKILSTVIVIRGLRVTVTAAPMLATPPVIDGLRHAYFRMRSEVSEHSNKRLAN
eukprot:SAG11_NODE_2144_length_3754_cov_2.328591_3_plen_86_part_00